MIITHEQFADYLNKVREHLDWAPPPFVDIVFDGPPGPEAGRFVEVDDHNKRSIKFGEWIAAGCGQWRLRINSNMRLYFLALALNGEAGELANLVKKEWRGDTPHEGHDRRAEIINELADVAGYAFLLAAELGVDLLAETYRKVREAEQKQAFKDHQAGKST
jgi:NTP pyrophosphatase (non-canonical NTP hydrolase)